MFLGVTCEKGKKYSRVAEDAYCITMASLEPRDTLPANKQVSLMLEKKTNEFLVCTLEYNRVMQVNLNLRFSKGEDVTFFVNGDGNIHLTGYMKKGEEIESIPDLVEDSIEISEDEDEEEGEEIEDAEDDEMLSTKRLFYLDDSEDDDSEDWVPENEENGVVKKKKKKIVPQKKANNTLNNVSESDEAEDEEEEEEEEEEADDDEEVEGEEEESDDDELGEDVESGDLTESDENEEEEEDNGKRKRSRQDGSVSKRAKNDTDMNKKKKVVVEVVTPEPQQKKSAKEFGKKFGNRGGGDKGDSDEDLNSSIGRTPIPSKKLHLLKKSKVSSMGEYNQQKSADSRVKELGISNEKKLKKTKEKFMKSSEKEEKFSLKLAGGVEAEDIRIGNGPVAKAGRFVHIYYCGKVNGKEFDAAREGKKPYSFCLGRGESIKGFDVGIEGMKVGGKRRLKVPPNMGFGKSRYGAIPPNSTLYFTVQLQAVS